MWRTNCNRHTNKSNRFFFITIRSGDVKAITRLYGKMNAETKSLLEGVIQMTYFMRGAIQYDYALYGMSYVERELVNQYISDRLEKESKSPHPVY